MKKIALVYSFKESEWFSCTLICRNLVSSYENAFGKENVYHINYSRQRSVSHDDLKLIFSEKIDKLIFIDHIPTPVTFLERLEEVNSDKDSWPEVLIHVFGDYPLYLPEWRSVNKILFGYNVKYICASERQANYLAKYIKQKEIISISPFPVDSKKFFLDKQSHLLKEKYNLPKSSKVLIYTGRLSYQKRIVEMVEAFLICKNDNLIPKDTYLFLVGEFDNLGHPYLSYSQLQGEYFRNILHVIEKYPEYQDSIIMTGNVDNNELRSFYNEADAFISFSTYHDEDFGMSIAEALCCGLPVILTDWAGYHSFNLENIKHYLSFIPVSLGKEIPKIELEDMLSVIQGFFEKDIKRSEIAQAASEYLSIENVGKRLKNICEASAPRYKGGTDLMIQITNEQYVKNMEFFRSEISREFNQLYYKVYDAYVE